MRHSTEYLYGIDPSDIMKMTYKIALQFKLDVGSELYYMLSSEPYKDQDTDRMFYVMKAITHTRKLLDELTNLD